MRNVRRSFCLFGDFRRALRICGALFLVAGNAQVPWGWLTTPEASSSCSFVQMTGGQGYHLVALVLQMEALGPIYRLRSTQNSHSKRVWQGNGRAKNEQVLNGAIHTKVFAKVLPVFCALITLVSLFCENMVKKEMIVDAENKQVWLPLLACVQLLLWQYWGGAFTAHVLFSRHSRNIGASLQYPSDICPLRGYDRSSSHVHLDPQGCLHPQSHCLHPLRHPLIPGRGYGKDLEFWIFYSTGIIFQLAEPHAHASCLCFYSNVGLLQRVPAPACSSSTAHPDSSFDKVFLWSYPTILCICRATMIDSIHLVAW